MFKLFTADLRKYSRTKMIYIVLAITVVLNLLSVLIYANLSETQLELFDSNGYRVLLDSLNPSSNSGLIIYVIAGVLVSQEFSHGTIRNKIIAGHKRWHVYLSMSLSTILVSVILYLLNALISGGVGSLALGYGRTWNIDEFWRISKIITIATMVFIVFLMISIFISMLIRNTGISIIVAIFTLLLLSLTLILGDLPINNIEKIREILSYTPSEQIYRFVVDDISRKLLIRSAITSPIYYLLITGLGSLIFVKRDIK